MRGDIHELKRLPDTEGHEQRGPRFAVVLQSDDAAALSTVIVAPTSTRAAASPFRPETTAVGERTVVMLDQTRAVDVRRLGPRRAALHPDEMSEVNRALRTLLALDLPW